MFIIICACAVVVWVMLLFLIWADLGNKRTATELINWAVWPWIVVFGELHFEWLRQVMYVITVHIAGWIGFLLGLLALKGANQGGLELWQIAPIWFFDRCERAKLYLIKEGVLHPAGFW